MNRRWKCPACGVGWMAPGRMRRDDVRRFCLECSASSGRLVEMGCPALETARHEAKVRSATKAKRKRAAATAVAQRKRARDHADAMHRAEANRLLHIQRYTIAGVDALDEVSRLWNLEAMKRQPRWKPIPPQVIIRRSETKLHTSGHANYNGKRLVVTVGRDQAEGLGVLLHELCHPLIGHGKAGEYRSHPQRFWDLLQSAAREAWPECKFPFHEDRPGNQWFLQDQVTRGLRPWLRAEGRI